MIKGERWGITHLSSPRRAGEHPTGPGSCRDSPACTNTAAGAGGLCWEQPGSRSGDVTPGMPQGQGTLPAPNPPPRPLLARSGAQQPRTELREPRHGTALPSAAHPNSFASSQLQLNPPQPLCTNSTCKHPTQPSLLPLTPITAPFPLSPRTDGSAPAGHRLSWTSPHSHRPSSSMEGSGMTKLPKAGSPSSSPVPLLASSQSISQPHSSTGRAGAAVGQAGCQPGARGKRSEVKSQTAAAAGLS